MVEDRPHIGYEARDGVAVITLSQPARMNAMTLDMWRDLPVKLRQADEDAEVRMITVSGAGERAFCAGADISEFGERRTGETAVAAYGAAVKEANAALADTAKPTVALIKGICFGGGFALPCAATSGSRRRIPASAYRRRDSVSATRRAMSRASCGASAWRASPTCS